MFQKYVTTLIEEKNIDLSDTFVIEMTDFAHIYEYGQFIEDLCEFTNDDPTIQEKIKATFVKIDFLNGDIKDYVKHLATGIVKAYGGAQ